MLVPKTSALPLGDIPTKFSLINTSKREKTAPIDKT
jgi:hypothetical protein